MSAHRSRSILILGAGYMQLPAIRAARRLGLTVIVADGNDEAVGRAEADEFLHIDLKDQEQMAQVASALVQSRGLSAVFTAGTDFSATVAYAAEAAGLPGTPYANALSATDKYRMREVLRAAGVRVPDFSVVSVAELENGLPESVRALSLPVVVKPADSMGARGVVRADSWEDVERHATTAAGYSRTGRVVIEGYIPGPEFSIDALVYEDTVQITGFADRHISFEPFFIETGHTIPTELDPESRQIVVDEFIRGVRALGLGPGAAKGDMKLSPGGPVVGEIANRLSGGYMSGWTYPYASGVPLSELGIRIALGESPGAVRETRAWTSAERAVISIPGKISSVDGIEAASGRPGVEDVITTRGPGDRIRFPQNNVEKAGNVIAAASSRAQAIRCAEGAVSQLMVRLAARDTQTDRFLFGPDDPDARHWAFPTARPMGESLRVTPAELANSDLAGSPRLRIPQSLFDQNERDWSYRTVSEAIECACSYHDLPVEPVSDTPVEALSVAFVRALLRGGAQGALYVLDCVVRA